MFTAFSQCTSTINVALVSVKFHVKNYFIPASLQLVNARNGGGATPLHRAVQTGGADSVARLLRAGADVTATLPGGVGVLHVAARRRDAELLRLLLARDRKLRRRQVDLLDSLPTSGLGALHVAAMLGDVQSLTALLEGGGDGALRTSELPHRSATALHLAAAGNHDDALAQLLAHEPRLIQVTTLLYYIYIHKTVLYIA